MTFPDLHTSRLWLRSILPGDQPDIFKGLSDAEVVRYYGISYRSLEATQEQMKWYDQLEKNNAGKWWAICLAGSTQLMGTVGIYHIKTLHRKCEIGFWLQKEFWGKGYIHEAAGAVIQFSFGPLKLHRIEATVETENKASIKTLSKLGFRLEGTQRECEWKYNRWIDLHQFALLNEDDASV
jgi:ribosomal-protein-alanine N-acetyltransferase